MNILHFAFALVALLTMNTPARSQERAHHPEPREVLSLDTTVTAEVQPDTAYVVLAVDRQGTDATVLTNEVNQVIARALGEAKAASGVKAATGNYSTYPRYDNKGQRNGWQVRAELILKAREFGVLGTLAGKLAKEMTIASNGFEVSQELRSKEEAALIEKGAAAFRAKALAASKAFGFASFTVREVSVGSIGGAPPVAPKMQMMRGGAADAAEPMPMEPGERQLSLTVSGSVQMSR
jgi:predicted secreted protein